MVRYRRESDKSLKEITRRAEGRMALYNDKFFHDEKPAGTITARGSFLRFADGELLSAEDFINASTFPQDYDFCGRNNQYVCGMSVPPVMSAQIASEIYEQWLK